MILPTTLKRRTNNSEDMKADCPECKEEIGSPKKTWKYSLYTVYLYSCPNCQLSFRKYFREDKPAFTLKKQSLKKGGLTKV
jgi:hypothetical protein